MFASRLYSLMRVQVHREYGSRLRVLAPSQWQRSHRLLSHTHAPVGSRCCRLRPTTRVDRGSVVADVMRTMHRQATSEQATITTTPRTRTLHHRCGDTRRYATELDTGFPRASAPTYHRCLLDATVMTTAARQDRRCCSSHDTLNTNSAAHCYQRGGRELGDT